MDRDSLATTDAHLPPTFPASLASGIHLKGFIRTT